MHVFICLPVISILITFTIGLPQNCDNSSSVNVMILYDYAIEISEFAYEYGLAKSMKEAEQKNLTMPCFNIHMVDARKCKHEKHFEYHLLHDLLEFAITQTDTKIDAIITPYVCSHVGEQIAGISAYEWDSAVISLSPLEVYLTDKESYPTAIHISLTAHDMVDGLLEILKTFGWRKFSLMWRLHSDIGSTLFNSITEKLIAGTGGNEMQLLNVEVYANQSEFDHAIQKMAKYSRVMILVQDEDCREQWDKIGDLIENDITEYTFVFVAASDTMCPFNGSSLEHQSIFISPSSFATKRVKKLQKEFIKYTHDWERRNFTRGYLPLLVDAFHLLGHVSVDFKQSAKNFSGLAMFQMMHNISIQGESGMLEFNNGDRMGELDVQKIVKNELVEVGMVHFSKNVPQRGTVNFIRSLSLIEIWPQLKGQAPKDEPECGFDGGKCNDNTIYIIVGIGTFACLSAIIAYAYLWQKMKKKTVGSSMAWLLQHEAIDIREVDAMSYDSGNLDDTKDILGAMSHACGKFGKVNGSLVVVQTLKCARKPEITADVVKALDQTMVFDKEFAMTTFFQNSFIEGILKGLTFIHKSAIKFHGQLTLRNVLVTQNFAIKLSEFGTLNALKPWNPEKKCGHGKYLYIQKAPEKRMENAKLITVEEQVADIYALAILLYELLYRDHFVHVIGFETHAEAYMTLHTTPSQVPLPHLPIDNTVPNHIRTMLIQCWNPKPANRPSLRSITKNLQSAGLTMNPTMMEQTMKMFQERNIQLEQMVTERTKKLQEAQRRTEDLLCQLLPRSVVEALEAGEVVPARTFECATLGFTDMVEFTVICSKSTPIQIIAFLNELYSAFDSIIKSEGVFKVETIGDAYMLVAGVPKERVDHAASMSRTLLRMLAASAKMQVPHLKKPIRIRAGLDSGPVAAGIVGITAPKYCLFGDVVNTASRMESNSLPSHVQMTKNTFQLVKDHFETEARGEISIKGKGVMETYWLKSENAPVAVKD